MGKSNKFDFTNRNNSGLDLGLSIAKTLVKESEKVAKDAERAILKARKQSSSSSSGTTAGHGVPDHFTHIIDLQAPGKELTDEGVMALINGLEVALQAGSPQASLVLEDLNLSGNNLTTASLSRMTSITYMARHTLKTINLTNNNIRVETDEQAVQWEDFLDSFKECFCLRRLDLSGNRHLGARAFEILARVYLAEEPVTLLPLCGSGSVRSIESDHMGNIEFYPTLGPFNYDDSDEESDDGEDKLAGAVTLHRRCGLRSIPYLTFRDVGMNDAGALWLSYILQIHAYPNQLTDGLNAVATVSQVKAYSQQVALLGLEWDENQTTLSKDGANALQKAGVARKQILWEREAHADIKTHAEDGLDTAKNGRPLKAGADASHVVRAPVGHRRSSVRSIHTDDGGEHDVTELESARIKLQRHIIEQHGAKSVELWRAAINFVAVARCILMMSPVNRQHHIGLPLFDFPDTAARAPSTVSNITNMPVPPRLVYRDADDSSSNGSSFGFHNITKYFRSVAIKDTNPARFVRHQQNRIDFHPLGPKRFRNTETASHLPVDIQQSIIRLVLGDKTFFTLSSTQQTEALTVGQKRATLQTEMEWHRKDESSQVWYLLKMIKCLDYQQQRE